MPMALHMCVYICIKVFFYILAVCAYSSSTKFVMFLSVNKEKTLETSVFEKDRYKALF